ncbi:MAG: bifunctional lysylphosphatidylglycerol flippase/synthetase MprF [Hyphomonadaceae bacterium]
MIVVGDGELIERAHDGDLPKMQSGSARSGIDGPGWTRTLMGGLVGVMRRVSVRGTDDVNSDQASPERPRRKVWSAAGSLPPWLTTLLALALFGGAIFIIQQELGVHGYRSIAHSLAQLSPGEILAGIFLTLCSFACLVGGEQIAHRILGKKTPLGSVWRPAFTAYALGNALGFSFATGPAARARLYRGVVAPAEIAGLSALTGLGVALGAMTAAGAGALFGASDLAARGFGFAWLWQLGGLVLVTPALAYLTASFGPSRRIVILGAPLQTQVPGRTLLQVLFVAGDWASAAGVLFILLPDHGGWSYPAFVAVFIASGMLGAVSGSPGGLGVFEASILALSPVPQHAPAAAAALLAYRLIYTLGPLGVAALLLGQDIVAPRGSPASRTAGRLGAAAVELAPQVFSLLAFASGILLLLSSATPAIPHRLEILSDFASLAIVEASHFLASVTGVFLLIIAAALWRKLEGAYFAALALLSAGAVFALLKGLDFEEATILGGVALALLPCRRAFARKSRLLSQPLALSWLAAIVGTVVATGWLGFLAFRNVEYSNDLWWTFLDDAQAPRFLRAAAGVAIVVVVASAWSLLGSPRSRWRGRPTPDDIDRAATVIAQAETGHSDAHLALLGDKDLIFSPSGRTFLMFRRRGGHWIAMGDPCGLASERRALLWRFVELADEAGAKPAFYSVSEAMLPEMAELGLVVRKIGETAIVPIPSFSLEGKKRASLRQGRNRVERDGISFELLPPGSASQFENELKAISDAWLAEHAGAEKQFSLGRFDLAYLNRTPLAVVRQGSEILAFANVWTTADRRELSIDLMRYGPAAPRAVMDFLFLELIMWGKGEGYREFDLGMAPLSGLDTHRLAPAFSRIGAVVFEEGEALYGFRGLRSYKDKFDPDWRPLYLAAAPGLSTAAAMLDVALLTSGGWRGLISR